nr:MAG TPA: hypothetical protein [Caudoviricetes sp.]
MFKIKNRNQITSTIYVFWWSFNVFIFNYFSIFIFLSNFIKFFSDGDFFSV